MPHGLVTIEDQVTWQLFRNDATEVVPPFAVLRITGVATVQGQQVLTVGKPNDTFTRYYAINAGGNVGVGKLGECTMSPACVVRTESVSGGTGSFGARSGQWGLEANRPGFTGIGLWTNTRGLYLLKAFQEPVSTLLGKTDAQIVADSAGTVSVHFQASGSASEYDVQGRLIWMHGSEAISANKQVLMQYIDGLWVITGAECET